MLTEYIKNLSHEELHDDNVHKKNKTLKGNQGKQKGISRNPLLVQGRGVLVGDDDDVLR